jgi:hypothetical protein
VIEHTFNMWDFPADLYVITTNGTVKANGEAVMGRGCAKEAADRWPWLPKLLGESINTIGNCIRIFNLGTELTTVVTMPVKHEFWMTADIELIEKNTANLAALAELWQMMNKRPPTVAMPRPGCGAGQLNWEDVRPIIAQLPDNFHVFSK